MNTTACNSHGTRFSRVKIIGDFKETISIGDPAVVDEAYNFFELDKKPTIIQPLHIVFPPHNDIEGTVLLLFVIDEKGDVVYVKTEKPVLGLNEAAVESILNFKYTPGEIEGKPVKVLMKQPYMRTRTRPRVNGRF